MRPQLCIASRNAHKLEEIRAWLGDCDVVVTSAGEYPECSEVDEDAPTLEGNAEKKARHVAACSRLPSLADDTGLEVDALNGAPGVISARWAGPGCTYADNNRKLLQSLAGVRLEKRTARFRSVIALAIPDPGAASLDLAERQRACRVSLHEGRIEGRILEAPRGERGFGYDPVFFVPELGRSLAELSLEEKNRISHRARALQAVRPALVEALGLRPGGAA
jgi:XTP/dITP diphosphohydrolase